MKIAILAALAASILLARPAGAQYPVDADACVVTRAPGSDELHTTYAPDERIVVEGDAQGADDRCFDPRTSVDVLFIQSEVKLATVASNPDGSYSTRGLGVTIPEGARPGAASIRATGRLGGRDVTYTQAITIAGEAPGLPTTGTDIALLVLWSTGLVVVGTLLISATWRRFRLARLESSLATEAAGVRHLDAGDHAMPRPTAPPPSEPVPPREPPEEEPPRDSQPRSDAPASRDDDGAAWGRRQP